MYISLSLTTLSLGEEEDKMLIFQAHFERNNTDRHLSKPSGHVTEYILPTCHSMSLPLELHLAIMRCVARDDLPHMARTCRSLQGHVYRTLYTRIEFSSGTPAETVLLLLKCLQSNEHLAALVQHLAITWGSEDQHLVIAWEEDDSAGAEDIANALESTLPRLKNLAFFSVSPAIRRHQWALDVAVMPALAQLHVYGIHNPLQPIKERHPALTHLSVADAHSRPPSLVAAQPLSFLRSGAGEVLDGSLNASAQSLRRLDLQLRFDWVRHKKILLHIQAACPALQQLNLFGTADVVWDVISEHKAALNSVARLGVATCTRGYHQRIHNVMRSRVADVARTFPCVEIVDVLCSLDGHKHPWANDVLDNACHDLSTVLSTHCIKLRGATLFGRSACIRSVVSGDFDVVPSKGVAMDAPVIPWPDPQF